MKQIKQITVLERADIEKTCPSFYATAPKHDVSDKYTFLNTKDIAYQLWDMGWMPTYAREARAVKSDNKGLTRHVVRWSHPDYSLGAERIELVGVNSHNRAAAFNFMAGVFRLVCSNGMVVKSADFGGVKIRHIGSIEDQVQDAVKMVADNAGKIAGSIDKFKAIELSPDEQGVYAQAVHSYLYPPEGHAPIQPQQLLSLRRMQDRDNSLYSTFNRVQENVIKGGLRGQAKTGRRLRTRAVKDIGKDVKLNQALWTLTEEMAKLKS